MIKRMLVPLMFLFTMPVLAAPKSDTPIIISYEQFSNLTRAEQKTYVKKLREMLLKIEESNPKAAAELIRGSSLLRQIASLTVPQAEAQQNGTKTFTDDDYITVADQQLTEARLHREALEASLKKKDLPASERANLISRYQGALAWIGMSGINANQVQNKEDKEAFLVEVKKELEAAKLIEEPLLKKIPKDDVYKAKADFGEAKKAFVEPSIAGSLSIKTKSSHALAAINLEERKAKEAAAATAAAAKKTATTTTTAATAATTAPATTAAATTTAANVNPVPPVVTAAGVRPPPATKNPPKATAATATAPAPVKAAPQAATAAPAKEEKTSAKTKDGEAGEEKKLFRCIHSGFVITGAKCIAPSTLPMDLEKIDENTFKCADGTIMCNPFVFGVSSKGCDWKSPNADCWKNAKPYCIRNAAWATQVCVDLSKVGDSLESAVELIHANPEAFRQFGADFQSLCDQGNIDYDSYRRTKRTKRSREIVKNDIEKTCLIAQAESEKISLRFGEKYPNKVNAATKEKLGQPSGNKAAPPAPKAGQK